MRVEAVEALSEVVRRSRLVPDGTHGVAMISGGADSACLAAGLTRALGPERVHALHVNYGLRPTSDRDEATCRRLCAALRIDLHVERVRLPASGNLQDAARQARYDAAERLRERTAGDWIATGHTRTDLAETFIYRLAASPGSRSLLGMRARNGWVVRPLLALERDDSRAFAAESGLAYDDDESNADLGYARNRIRARVLPELEAVGERAQRNIAETQAEMLEEAGLIERVALDALERAGAGAGATAVRPIELSWGGAALARVCMRMLAERAAGRTVALNRRRTAEILRLSQSPEGGTVEIGGGVRAVCESGWVRFEVAGALDASPAVHPAVSMSVPGACRVGDWEVQAQVAGVSDRIEPGLSTLDARALGGSVEVRTWREGDRIRPLGMRGTKTLGDLFTDRGVPRSLRDSLPVVVAGGRIAWVAGVAISDDFRLPVTGGETVVLTARPAA
ncbi:tRNA lysidine(34) synthetase TilS [Thermoleophilia bacterium SCSIO 60948]|nr:tRNA lysidine(34) synthetase TilS [Thermoleophilia bacterium SCSIO 60948]